MRFYLIFCKYNANGTGYKSYNFIPIMQRDQAEDPPLAGAQAAASPRTQQEVFQSLQLSEFSDAQLTAFVDSKAHYRKFLTFVLKFVEYNRAKYELLKVEYGRLNEEVISH